MHIRRLANFLTRSTLAFQRLSWRERLWVGEALILLPTAKLVAARVLRARCERQPDTSTTASSAIQLNMKATARAVALAAKALPYRPNCLQRSTVLWLLLRQQGIEAQMRIGVKRGECDGVDALDAHAWVEVGGVPVNDSEDIATQFSPFEESFAPNATKIR